MSYGSCYVSHISSGLSGAGSDSFICIYLCFAESSNSYSIFRVLPASAVAFSPSLVFKKCEGSVEDITSSCLGFFSNISKIRTAGEDACVKSRLYQVVVDCMFFLFLFFFLLHIPVSLGFPAPSIALFIARVREQGL